MRAWITTIRDDGSECLGTEHQMVSNEYKTRRGLIRAAFRYLDSKIATGFAHRVRVYLHRDWDTRYSEADEVLTLSYMGISKVVVS